MRLRTAAILAVVALLFGIVIGATGSKPTSSEPAASGIALASASPTTAPTAAPTAVPTAATIREPPAEPPAAPTVPPAEPIVMTGTGSQNTPPFDLPGGDYTVSAAGSADSNVIIDLVPRGGGVFDSEGLLNEIADGSFAYSTVAYSVDPGSYYLDVTCHGSWTVTFTPLP
jgi:hypothetical protein